MYYVCVSNYIGADKGLKMHFVYGAALTLCFLRSRATWVMHFVYGTGAAQFLSPLDQSNLGLNQLLNSWIATSMLPLPDRAIKCFNYMRVR